MQLEKGFLVTLNNMGSCQNHGSCREPYMGSSLNEGPLFWSPKKNGTLIKRTPPQKGTLLFRTTHRILLIRRPAIGWEFRV